MDQFWWKNGQKRKIAIFWYFTKMEITQVQNDLESWNLAKLWRIILSKIASRHFLIILVFLEFLTFSSQIWPFLRDFGQILAKNCNFGQNLRFRTAIKSKRMKISKIPAYRFCITLISTYMNKFSSIGPAVFSNLVNLC